MKINWLLEDSCFEDNIDAMKDAIKRSGAEYKIVKYVPFDDPANFFHTCYAPDECVVFMGSLQASKIVHRFAKWSPGLYATLPNYDCTNYYPLFGDYLLNENYVMLPFGELGRRKEWLFDNVAEDDHLFIRPNAGNKLFTGRLVSLNTWDKDLYNFNLYDPPSNALVVVASPKNIEEEWRLIIVDDKIVASSLYRNKIGPKLQTNAPWTVIDFAESVLHNVKYKPDNAWCLDICKTKAGNLAVLEVGCFSCAGLYACDMDSIVNAVNKLAWKDWKELSNV